MKAEKYAYDAMFLNSDAVPHLHNIQLKFKNIECWNGPLFEFYNYVVHLFYIEEEFLMFINSPINVFMKDTVSSTSCKKVVLFMSIHMHK